MSISNSLSRCVKMAAAACLVGAVAAPAEAGVIASFDPAFGASIPNLGFRGSITLDVTAGCYALGGGFHATGANCQITAESAQINYYNSTTNSNNLTTVNLAGSFFAANYVSGGYFDPTTGQLAGLDTNNSDQFQVSVTDGNFLLYAGDMLLYFVSGTQPIQINQIASAVAPAVTTTGVGGAFLVNCNPTNQQETNCVRGNPSTNSNPGRLTFTTVPEPGSVALAMIGLAGLAATRRRSRNAVGGRSRGA